MTRTRRSTVSDQGIELGGGLKSKVEKVRIRVLLPLTIVVFGLVCIFGFSLYSFKKNEINKNSLSAFRITPQAYQDILDNEAVKMGAVLEVLARNEKLRSAFQAGDRQGLLALSGDLFKSLQEEYHITHLYFHSPDRVNFLRVHHPWRYGDKVNLFSLIAAERTGKVAGGVELGPLGTLTLRVARPWYEADKLIGYIEIGEDVRRISQKPNKAANLDFVITLKKKYLDREKWEIGRRLFGRDTNWDRYPASVVIDQTIKTIPPAIAWYFSEGRNEHYPAGEEVASAGRVYRVSSRPLKDVAGRELGEVVMLRDVTSTKAAFRETAAVILLSCLVMGGGLFVFFYVCLGRIEKRMVRQTAEMQQASEDLQRELAERRQVEKALRKSEGFYRTTFELGLIGISVSTADDMRWVEVNDRLCEMLGYTRQELQARTWQDITFREDLDEDLEQFGRMLAGEIDGYILDKRFLRKDGQLLYATLSVRCSRNPDGSVEHVFALIFDITDRKHAEEELKNTISELERFNRLAVGREMRMIELKQEVNELARKAHRAPPYDLSFADAGDGGLAISADLSLDKLSSVSFGRNV